MLPFDLSVLNKAFLLISATTLLGALALPLFVLPARTAQQFSRTLFAAAAMAGLGVVLFSLLDMYFVLAKLGRGVSGELFMRYLQSTRHGTAVMWRGAFVVLTLLGSFFANRFGRPALALGAIGGVLTIASISYTSHAAAVGTFVALASDVVHFGLTGIWAGSILVGLVLPIWHRGEIARVAQRIALLGGIAAGLIVLTGVFSALLHTEQPDLFVGSPYALALIVKIVLAVVVFAVAGVNRFVHMPRLASEQGPEKFRRGVRTEAIFLLILFLVTGILTSAEMPHIHDPANAPTVFENAYNLWTYLTGER